MEQTDQDYIRAARKKWHRDGEIEIDTDAEISESSGGAYVAAWVWVSDGDTSPLTTALDN
jgi:hypothetical protein